MDKQIKILQRNNSKEWVNITREMLLNIWHGGDKPVKVTVENYTVTRRQAQNNLMWIWHNEYVKHRYECAGEVFSPKLWHEAFKEQFVGVHPPVEINGKFRIIPQSTTELSVKGFSEMLQKYEAEAAMDGCKFSHPEDLYLKAVMQDEK